MSFMETGNIFNDISNALFGEHHIVFPKRFIKSIYRSVSKHSNTSYNMLVFTEF